MRKLILIVCGLILCSFAEGQIKVACIGNSITAGAGIRNNFQNSYPGILSEMLGEGYDVRNFGRGGTCTLKKGDFPYFSCEQYQEALKFQPDIVTIKMGTNDSKSFNWEYSSEFESDFSCLIKSFQDLPSRPKIYICLPAPSFYYSSKMINDSTIQAGIIPLIKKIAKKMKLPVIDIHTALQPYGNLFPDKIHPNAEGSYLIAKTIYKGITGNDYSGDYDVNQPLPGKKGSMDGYDTYSFWYHGNLIKFIRPKKFAYGNPWIWSSMDSLSDLDRELLKRGYYVAIGKGTDQLYSELQRYYGMASKIAIESANIDWILGNQNKAASVLYTGDGECNVKVPVIKSGSIEALADFIFRNRPEFEKFQNIHYRGTLQNAFLKFSQEKKGCVAFFGGSITEMDGWRNMIENELKYRFPDCDFKFIEAGIGSLGSIPHVFRFEEDVLKKGTPDLMFIESAVNDDTNTRGEYVKQTRSMEGIVRHALTVNPYMDILMLHFIYDPFIPLHKDGIEPDVVMNHERIANWYSVTSIDLIDEIASRMENGQFTWNDFGGTHPAWFGHKFYAAAIDKVFDMQKPSTEMKSHTIPSTMLDDMSYQNGHFIEVDRAEKLNGFTIDKCWNSPLKGAGTRKQYVNVPMLYGKEGASLEIPFEGTAIGIYGTFGPNSGIIEYSLDGKSWKSLNTHTAWSNGLYIPWTFILEDALQNSKHVLHLRVKSGDCLIYKFVVS